MVPGMADAPISVRSNTPSRKRSRPTPQGAVPLRVVGGVDGDLLISLVARDAVPDSYEWPAARATGKSGTDARSLLIPQDLARRLLPAEAYRTLVEYSRCGVPTDCGPDWSRGAVKAAKAAGPHVSALLPENVTLMWEDIEYQVKAGFVTMVTETELFKDGGPPNLKISRVAVVPQVSRRGRIILNLSADVNEATPNKRRRTHHPKRLERPAAPLQVSVNATTVPADDQEAVLGLGRALPSLLRFMFDVPPDWKVEWQKVDLSDGFWRMIVQRGTEHNFVFQMPPRAGDTEAHYVVPASLQMGWKNSPPYFCTATEITKQLMLRLLALTTDTGMTDPHPLDEHWRPIGPTTSSGVGEVPVWARVAAHVFVDDFMNGIAIPPGKETGQERVREWVGRAAMHAIHAVFPPPHITGHEGGKDSISIKKCLKGDARFDPNKVMLGFLLQGGTHQGRLVGLPEDKAARYREAIQEALARPRNFISLNAFEQLHGKLQHASIALPTMRGFMTPLNKVLGRSPTTVGLARGSELREVLEQFVPMITLACERPSHITELVSPDLPHYYKFVDSSAVGAGGVILPCTKWIQPTVWRMKWPADVEAELRQPHGKITNSDGEAGAVFIDQCLMADLLGPDIVGSSEVTWSDNSPTVGWVKRMASRALSRCPARLLRWLALLQRFYRKAPFDVIHVEGKLNELGDVPSRSYPPETKGFPDTTEGDALFLVYFANRFPLPPQLGSWRFVRPRTEVCSAVNMLVRGRTDTVTRTITDSGLSGVSLPETLANTLTSETCRDPVSTWNEDTCSFPLLGPSGEVSSTMAGLLRARPSRERYNTADSAWSTTDFGTLAGRIRPSPTSTAP
jgi:hypothetical protein